MSLRSNIWKIFAIQGLRWFMIAMPIMTLFLLDNGLTLNQILILQAVFSITIVAVEIPSGYWSDLFGRKSAIVLGTILAFLGYGMYSIGFDFWTFLVGEILLGIGVGFVSGADSALLYDSLAPEEAKSEYKKLEGRKGSFENASEGIASILGGFLAVISLRLPFYVETAVLFLAIPIALSLKEPVREKLNNIEGNFKTLMRIVKFSLFEQKGIRWVMIYAAVVAASGLSVVWFIQPYLLETGLPLAYLGIVWALFQFVTAFFAYNAHTIEEYIGKRTLFISAIFMTFAAYMILGLTFSLYSGLAFLLFYIVRGTYSPITKDYVNQITPSEMRATVLSVKNMVSRLIFSVVGPILGYAADVYTLQTALLISGCIYVVLGSISIFFLHKHKVV